jgi:hypothetical protein
MGVVAKYFGGATSWEYLLSLTFPEVWFLYEIYEYQATYDQVRDELSKDPKTGKPRSLPSEKRIREIVDARIAESRQK